MTTCTYSSSCSKSAWHEGLCRDHAREAYTGVALEHHTVANRGVCLTPQCGARVTTPLYYCPAHADRLARWVPFHETYGDLWPDGSHFMGPTGTPLWGVPTGHGPDGSHFMGPTGTPLWGVPNGHKSQMATSPKRPVLPACQFLSSPPGAATLAALPKMLN